MKFFFNTLWCCLCLLICGCAPVFQNYVYISLENTPNIQILEYGKSSVSNLQKHKDMPVEYKLSRETYDIYLQLDTTNNGGPRLFVKVRGTNGKPLVLQNNNLSKKLPYERCGLLGEAYPQDKISENELAKVYEWYLDRKGCAVNDRNQEDRVISFKVAVTDGLIFEEILLFELVQNGFYILNDAI